MNLGGFCFVQITPEKIAAYQPHSKPIAANAGIVYLYRHTTTNAAESIIQAPAAIVMP